MEGGKRMKLEKLRTAEGENQTSVANNKSPKGKGSLEQYALEGLYSEAVARVLAKERSNKTLENPSAITSQIGEELKKALERWKKIK